MSVGMVEGMNRMMLKTLSLAALFFFWSNSLAALEDDYTVDAELHSRTVMSSIWSLQP